jgi:uncharacterized protein YceK
MIKLLILLLVCLLLAGCYSGLFPGKTDSGQGSGPQTPSDQMWQAVKKSNWMITVSILGVAVGTFALLNGSKVGLPAIVASCVSLFMSLAVARYAGWMAVCGLIGAVAACAVSILVKNKAFVEIIKGVQEVKNKVTTISKDAVNDVLAGTQSKLTQNLVQKVKSTLKLKGEIS